MEKHDVSREPRPISTWLERYRRSWNLRFQRLDVYLRQLQKEEKPHGR
jgi:hypothetical protein